MPKHKQTEKTKKEISQAVKESKRWRNALTDNFILNKIKRKEKFLIKK